MRIIKLLSCVAVSVLCLTACAKSGETQHAKATPVILDTDVGNDVDDVLALQMLINYQQAGEIDLLGITLGKCNPHTIEYVDAYCRLRGLDSIPLGFAYNGVNPENNGYLCQTLDTIIDGKKILEPKRGLSDSLPEGYKLIRRLLAAQPDSSVVMIAIGPETNLGRLLVSDADEYSSLNGRDLVAKKVKLLSVMGGNYTPEYDFPEWNIVQDLQASQTVFAQWPTPLVASGWEVGYKLPYPHQSILADFDQADPLAVSYKVYDKMPYDRATWDLTSVLYAIEPTNGAFEISEPGAIVVDSVGNTRFTPSEGGLHRYLAVNPHSVASTTKKIVEKVVNK